MRRTWPGVKLPYSPLRDLRRAKLSTFWRPFAASPWDACSNAAAISPLTAVTLKHYRKLRHERMFADGLAMLFDDAQIKLRKLQDMKGVTPTHRRK